MNENDKTIKKKKIVSDNNKLSELEWSSRDLELDNFDIPMGVYQTLVCICTICGKTIPTNTNPEIMSFVCEDCKSDQKWTKWTLSETTFGEFLDKIYSKDKIELNKKLKKYPPGETTVEGITKIMLPKNVEIENAHEVFTKHHSIRNVMVGYLDNKFLPVYPIKLSCSQKFFRWLKRIVKK